MAVQVERPSIKGPRTSARVCGKNDCLITEPRLFLEKFVPPSRPHNARTLALGVLNRLETGRLTLDRVMESALCQQPVLSRKDRALAQSLVFGTLRWQGRIDWILSRFSRTRLTKIDPPVLNLLRLALFQIVFLTRIPDSAAVNTAVEMAKTAHPHWVVRFVNGVLRNAAREHRSLVLPDMDADPVAAICVEKSFPVWLVQRWLDRMGEKETADLCDALNRIPPITLRVNTLRTDGKALSESLKGQVETVAPARYSPDGLSITRPRIPIPEMTAFRQGGFQVQDEAAQLVAGLVAPRPGQRVLDACAGLGGKTGHLAQQMENRGDLVAADISDERLALLGKEMARLGTDCVTAVHRDLEKPWEDQDPALFHRVLLDAPCTGLGVLRRNPDGKWRRTEEDIRRCGRRQVRLLASVAGLVRPGGTLVYTVCSTEPEENRGVVDRFCNTHPDFSVDPKPSGLPRAAAPLVDANGFFTSAPHVHGMDGFFAAVLRRK
jgi:16S rRNA (cytosine967-C5)-methyltransferase